MRCVASRACCSSFTRRFYKIAVVVVQRFLTYRICKFALFLVLRNLYS